MKHFADDVAKQQQCEGRLPGIDVDCLFLCEHSSRCLQPNIRVQVAYEDKGVMG